MSDKSTVCVFYYSIQIVLLPVSMYRRRTVQSVNLEYIKDAQYTDTIL